MSFCPNLSIPEVSKQFSELSNLFGESAAYYFWNKNNGHFLDKNSDGTPSELYNKALQVSGNKVEALTVAAVSKTEGYLKYAAGFKEPRKQKGKSKTREYNLVTSFVNSKNSNITSVLQAEAFRKTTDYGQATREELRQAVIDNQRNALSFKQKVILNKFVPKEHQGQALIDFLNNPISNYVSLRNMSRIVAIFAKG